MSKVMLVEDDNNLREIYEARLQAEGYTIVSAHDGEEALVIAKAEKPDLVISDVMMPKISGFEMLDILRNTDGLKDVKVIMLTALGQSDDQQRADKLGADRYLVKSQVTLEDIVKATHELLGEAPAGDTAAPATPPMTGTETAGSAAAPAAATPPPAAPAPTPTPPASPSPAAPVQSPAAPTPPATNNTAPTMPVQPAPADQKPTDADAASDDKLMNDAVNTLIADTDAASKPAPTPADDTAAAASSSQDDGKTDDSTDKPDAGDVDKGETEDTSNGHVKIANKKVITPIDSGPEKDLDALLAEEEAKEAAETHGTPAPVTDTDLAKAKAVLADATTEKAASSTADEEAAVDAKIEDFVAGATTEAGTPAPATPAAPAIETTTPEPESANAPTRTMAAAPAEEKPASPTSVIRPIIITEDAPAGAAPTSLSGNPGAPPATPTPDPKSPADPNSIAL